MTKTPDSATKTPNTVDALLNQVAQGTEFHFQSGLCGDWTLLAREPDTAALHLITQGDCWFGFPSSQTDVQALHAGDVVFVNQGVSHFLSRQPVPSQIPEQEISRFCQLEHQQHGVVCYDINSPSQTTDTVFRLLPPWVILSRQQQAHDMQALITMIRAETQAGEPGSQTVV